MKIVYSNWLCINLRGRASTPYRIWSTNVDGKPKKLPNKYSSLDYGGGWICYIHTPSLSYPWSTHDWLESWQICCMEGWVFFYQCSLQPNYWTKCYLHQDITQRFPFLKTPCIQWIKERQPAQKYSHKQREKKKRNDPPSYQIQNSQPNPTNIFFYWLHDDSIISDKT